MADNWLDCGTLLGMGKHTVALILASVAIAIPAAAGIQHTAVAPSRSPSSLTPPLHSIAAPASASPANTPPPPAALPPLPLALPSLPEFTPNTAPPSLDLDRVSPWENGRLPLANDHTQDSPKTPIAPIPKIIESVDQWTGAPMEHVVAKKMVIDRSDPWSDPPAPTETSL
jgi:hypothetical protein